jgi:glycosyltransferase involved in cell wall biosynthesis
MRVTPWKRPRVNADTMLTATGTTRPGAPGSIPVSVVVIAKNESANIGRCLQSLTDFDDVVVVDDFSEDETAEIAQAAGVRVVTNRFESFASQRNWALENGALLHDWVLMLDADESLTPKLCNEIRAAIISAITETINAAGANVAGFMLCRRNWFLDRFLRFADGYPVWIMRLVHRGRARFQDSGHGEVPVPPVDGVLVKIREPFLHYPFSHGIGQWVERHNAYSSREAQLEWRDPPRWTWRDLLLGDGPHKRRALRNLARSLPLRPLLRFSHHYFWKWGFLDGRAGLAYSLLMAGYEGLIALKRRELAASVGPPADGQQQAIKPDAH